MPGTGAAAELGGWPGNASSPAQRRGKVTGLALVGHIPVQGRSPARQQCGNTGEVHPGRPTRRAEDWTVACPELVRNCEIEETQPTHQRRGQGEGSRLVEEAQLASSAMVEAALQAKVWQMVAGLQQRGRQLCAVAARPSETDAQQPVPARAAAQIWFGR